MASGKSTVGPELARRLQWDFVDLDTRIQLREGQTVPEIFRHHGESGFRLAETSALRDLLTEFLPRPTIVALGGGAFVEPQNRELLRDWVTVFLHADCDELWQRSLSDGIERPLRRDLEQFTRLYEERLPLYREARITIDTTGKSVDSICAEIWRALLP
jgi:shikimate kinase